MSQENRIPIPVTRCVHLVGAFGVLLGVLIGSYNGESFAWALLRGGILGIIFAFVARRFLTVLVRYWLETRLDILTQKRIEQQKLNAEKEAQEKQQNTT